MAGPDEVQMPDRSRGEWRRRFRTLLVTGIVMFVPGAAGGASPELQDNIFTLFLTDGGVLLIVVGLVGLLVVFVRDMLRRPGNRPRQR